jgi:aryl-alcohol dehydrogenase-like predicted oxidoreductase
LQCEWSLWWRDAEDEIVRTARRLGIGIVPYSPLGRGFLAGVVDPGRLTEDDLRRGDRRFDGEAGSPNRALVDELHRIAEQWDATTARVALAWLLAQGDDVVPIPGTKNIRHLEENSTADSLAQSPEDLAKVERIAPRDNWAGDRVAFAGRQLVRR